VATAPSPKAATIVLSLIAKSFGWAAMDKAFVDPDEETVLRMLERRYARFASRIFRANDIPEPVRLPEPTEPEFKPIR
jgi:hypothetical protein